MCSVLSFSIINILHYHVHVSNLRNYRWYIIIN